MKAVMTKALNIIASAALIMPVSAQIKPVNERFDMITSEHTESNDKTEEETLRESFSGTDFVELASHSRKVTYIIGEDSQSETSKRIVKPFKINRYETTYSLWYRVRIWAEQNGYNFSNPGQEGSEGLRGKAPTQFRCNDPVTNINWYDAVVWCNAFSEMEGRTPCYSYMGEFLRDSADTATCDLSECNFDANGYRLPTETEWEYAARKTPKKLQSGSLASGQIDNAGDDNPDIPAGEVAWYYENAKGTHKVGTAGTPFDAEMPPSPGSGNPNGAGLFDMSGNVLEFCWDWKANYSETDSSSSGRYSGPKFGAERILRGGSWNEYTLFISAGDRYSFDPNEAYNYLGFRIATSE